MSPVEPITTPMSLRAYPVDGLEHELESWSMFLRSWDDAPAEVRIREEEGEFYRPQLLMQITAAGIQDESTWHYYETRGAQITWYGADGSPGAHSQAWRATTWLTRAIARNDDFYRGLVQIYSFHDPEFPLATDVWMELDGNISGVPVRDEYGLWTAQIEFNYQVERSPADSGNAAAPELPPPAIPPPLGGPYITTVNRTVVIP